MDFSSSVSDAFASRISSDKFYFSFPFGVGLKLHNMISFNVHELYEHVSRIGTGIGVYVCAQCARFDLIWFNVLMATDTERLWIYNSRRVAAENWN